MHTCPKCDGKGHAEFFQECDRCDGEGVIIACDQCQVLSIQGVACHETGCPNSWIDPVTGKAFQQECYACGSMFLPGTKGQRYCSTDCQESYYEGF